MSIFFSGLILLGTASLNSELLLQLFVVVIANQVGSFWGVNQSDSEKVVQSWSRSGRNIFFDVDIVVKNKSNVVSRCMYPYQKLLWTHSTVMTRIVVDTKSI